MSRSKFKNERTGEEYPRKTDKKRRTKSKDYGKFFGYHNGDNIYGYPSEQRHRETIKRHIESEIEKELLEEVNFNNAT